jgi:superfamily I DNA/RNA helicase
MLNDGDVWLQFHKAMLIGELIPEALRYLRNNPECPYLTAYDDIIVDEYQDLNKAEQSLLDLLSMNANLVIVGDENHSIYSFRHAHPEGIVEFADTHDGTYDESLVQCRSPIDVVALANHLISHNHDADYEPSLKPFDGNPEGEIHILQWPSINQEINGIVAYIEYLTSDCDYNPRDIFVLCPRRMIGYGIRDALRAANVSSHCFYPDETLSDDRGQLSFCLLSLLADRDDRVALRFWLGFGSSTWLEGQYRRLRNHCEDKDLSPWDALQQIHDGNDDLPGINKILERFDELTDALSDLEKPPRLRTR